METGPGSATGRAVLAEIKEDHLALAAAELDEVAQETAKAADTILQAAEIIDAITDGVDAEASQKLMDATAQIFEACGFQDITGQRITKVRAALGRIDEKLDALSAASRRPPARAKKRQRRKREKVAGDDALLNGPQRSRKAISQRDVDAILARIE